MEIDLYDVVYVEIRPNVRLPTSESSPIVIGTLQGGCPSYLLYWKCNNGGFYYGSGPSREGSLFLVADSEGLLHLHRPGPDEQMTLVVLRYDEDAYSLCRHYANRMRTEIPTRARVNEFLHQSALFTFRAVCTIDHHSPTSSPK